MKRLTKLILTIAIVIVGIICFKIITRYYPEVLWFESLGYASVWFIVLKAKLAIFSIFFLISFVFLSINVLIARKISSSTTKPLTPPEFPSPFKFLNQIFIRPSEQRSLEETLQLPGRLYTGLILCGMVILSLFFGLIAKRSWQKAYEFLHQVPFQLTDPIFSKDIGFYFFTIPFYEFLLTWAVLIVSISLGVSIWIYASKRLFLFIFSTNLSFSTIKKHIFVLLGFLFLCIAFSQWLNIYDVLYAHRGVVYGAGYTDVKALILARQSLVILCIIEAVLIFIWAFRKGFAIPLYFLGIIFITALFLGRIYPSLIQSFVVAPNEFVKEKPYIKHNISYTRKAYGLDKMIEEKFPVTNLLTKQDILNNSVTIDNIRLWNQGPLKQTFSQLQEIRLYYEFLDVDVDRYLINGNLQQVMLSPREMDTSQLSEQAQTWINQHLVYTHGYGLCMSPVNEISPEGLPHFYIKDLPPTSTIDLQVTRPEIYFGEKTLDYVVVNTKQQEFDYPKGDKNVYTNYAGTGGIVLNSLLRRLVFSIKFSEVKILISNLIQDNSRILFDRNIKTLTRTLAPFLIYEGDPYLSIRDNGRLIWIIDAYTASNKYPYSEPINSKINYIRNAVKITVDAYSGETHFYISDANDPIIQTYAKIYKGLFKTFDKIPKDIQQHLRYPKGIFSIQSQMFSTYHMIDEQVFYNREDLWSLPKERYEESDQPMDAYYLVTKLPGEDQASFIILLPFTPTNKNNMIAWMSAKCDPQNYGQLKVYKFPKKRMIYGPMQIESRVDQDTDISQKLTLWGQMGSRVIRGNLLVIPIEDSLIYVEPIYLQATQSKLPELKRVILAFDNKITMTPTLADSIDKIFGTETQAPEPKQTITKDTNVSTLISNLLEKYRSLKKQAQQTNWLEFGKRLNDMDVLFDKLDKKLKNSHSEK